VWKGHHHFPGGRAEGLAAILNGPSVEVKSDGRFQIGNNGDYFGNRLLAKAKETSAARNADP
jgi:hypothetical protein